MPENFRLTVPWFRPRSDDDHEANLRAIDRWANDRMYVGVHLQRTTNQTIATGGSYTVSWETVLYDSKLGLWSSAAPTVLTVPIGLGGLYSISFTTLYAAGFNSLANYAVFSVRSSGTLIANETTGVVSSTLNSTLTLSFVHRLAAGDTFDCRAFQQSGGSQTLDTAELSFFRIPE